MRRPLFVLVGLIALSAVLLAVQHGDMASVAMFGSVGGLALWLA